MLSRLPYQIGTVFALSAFAVSLGSGLVSNADPSQILIRSVVVLIGATAIGRMLGCCVRATLVEYLRSVAAAHPVPEPIPVPAAGESRAFETETEVNAESP